MLGLTFLQDMPMITYRYLQCIHGIAIGSIILFAGGIDQFAHFTHEIIILHKDPNGKRQLQTKQYKHENRILQNEKVS